MVCASSAPVTGEPGWGTGRGLLRQRSAARQCLCRMSETDSVVVGYRVYFHRLLLSCVWIANQACIHTGKHDLCPNPCVPLPVPLPVQDWCVGAQAHQPGNRRL